MGLILMSGACPLGTCWSVLHAELLAILNSLVFAKSSGFSKIILSSDCLNAINTVKEPRDIRYTDSVAQLIREESSTFSNIQFIFQRRESNEEANGLAKWGLNLSKPQILVADQPLSNFHCVY